MVKTLLLAISETVRPRRALHQGGVELRQGQGLGAILSHHNPHFATTSMPSV